MATVRYDRRDFLAWFFGAILLRAIGARASAQTENPTAAPVVDMMRQIRKTLDQIRAAIDATFG